MNYDPSWSGNGHHPSSDPIDSFIAETLSTISWPSGQGFEWSVANAQQSGGSREREEWEHGPNITPQARSTVTSISNITTADFAFSASTTDQNSTVATTQADCDIPILEPFDYTNLAPVTGDDHPSYLPEMSAGLPEGSPQLAAQDASTNLHLSSALVTPAKPQPGAEQIVKKHRFATPTQRQNRRKVTDDGMNCARCEFRKKPCSEGYVCQACKSKNIVGVRDDRAVGKLSFTNPFDHCVRRILGNINYFSKHFEELSHLELEYTTTAVGRYDLTNEQLEVSRQICFENAFVNVDSLSMTIFPQLVEDIDKWFGEVVDHVWTQQRIADFTIRSRDQPFLQDNSGISLFIKTNVILTNMNIPTNSDTTVHEVKAELQGVRAFTAMHAFAVLEHELMSTNFRKEERLAVKIAVINMLSALFEQVLDQREYLSQPDIPVEPDVATSDLKALVRTLWNWLKCCVKSTFSEDSEKLLGLIIGADERALLHFNYWQELHDTCARAQELEDAGDTQSGSTPPGKIQKVRSRFQSASEDLKLATAWNFTSDVFKRLRSRLQDRRYQDGPGIEWLHRFGDKCNYPHIDKSSPSQSNNGRPLDASEHRLEESIHG